LLSVACVDSSELIGPSSCGLKLSSANGSSVETPWADSLGGKLYRLENSPWWRGDLSWRDVVRAEPLEDGDFPTVVALVEAGGHKTLRVLFDAGISAAGQRLLLEELVTLGATYEGTGAEREGVYAIDVAPDIDVGPVDAALRQAARAGRLRYQHGGDPAFLTLLDGAVRTQNWTARHEEPLVPADAAELVIVACAGHALFEGVQSEQLWARRCRDGRYEILSAAFVAYELYVGDVVRVEQREHRLPRVVGLDERSGRRLLRVQASEDGAAEDAVLAQLEAEDARIERASRWPGYFAVDVEDDGHASRVRSSLVRRSRPARWSTRPPGRRKT